MMSWMSYNCSESLIAAAILWQGLETEKHEEQALASRPSCLNKPAPRRVASLQKDLESFLSVSSAEPGQAFPPLELRQPGISRRTLG